MNDETMARSLGWFSVALGAAEVLMPRQIERALGLPEGKHTTLVRALGVRELAHGAAILLPRDPSAGVASRVPGDALDTAALVAAATQTRAPARFAAIAASVMVVGALDVWITSRLAQRRSLQQRVAPQSGGPDALRWEPGPRPMEVGSA